MFGIFTVLHYCVTLSCIFVFKTVSTFAVLGFFNRYLGLQFIGMCCSGIVLFKDDSLIVIWILVFSWAGVNGMFSDAMTAKSRNRAVCLVATYIHVVIISQRTEILCDCLVLK